MEAGFIVIGIAVAFLLAGYITSLVASSGINQISGYRTRRSMMNQDTWKEANSYSAILWYYTAGIYFLLSMFILMLLHAQTNPVLIASSIILIPLIAMHIILVEVRLRKLFDDQGNRK